MPPRQVRADTEETRRAILQAARTLFMELGYRAVTTRMVAEACGVKQPLLYYHFADKETLYLEVMREQGASSQAALERIAARQQESVAERLRHAVYYLRGSSHHNMGLFFHELKHEMTPEMRASLRQVFHTSIVAPIMRIFEDGVASGYLQQPAESGVSPRFATYLLLKAVSSSGSMESEEESGAQESGRRMRNDPLDALLHVLLYGMVEQTRRPLSAES